MALDGPPARTVPTGERAWTTKAEHRIPYRQKDIDEIPSVVMGEQSFRGEFPPPGLCCRAACPPCAIFYHEGIGIPCIIASILPPPISSWFVLNKWKPSRQNVLEKTWIRPRESRYRSTRPLQNTMGTKKEESDDEIGETE
eukprot:TRINITY_DN111925_c0_g1_i1.p1 TRINITY_DN111925_c0_g1~~TRINITY_DN111925_c0_g1_i1.p1  ORF type:complete len:141 (+),score=19.58 TRINITY_DN111925_c0_g1_i1:122-544(+)